MKVYALKAYGSYCGGMAVVAANNIKQATEMAIDEYDGVFGIDWAEPASTSVLDVFYDGAPKVLAYFATGE